MRLHRKAGESQIMDSWTTMYKICNILLFIFISNYYYFPRHLHIPQVSEVSGLEIVLLALSPTEYVGDSELSKANKYIIS